MAITRRGIRLALGSFWTLDGVLQLQPAMFTDRFASQVIRPAGTGQPEPIHSLILLVASIIAAHPITLDLLFAFVQLGIGIELLVGRHQRVALLVSASWGVGVWLTGEGLGGLLSGTALIWNGAPGAALLYIVLSFASWPRTHTSSVEGVIDQPSRWVAKAWFALWATYAVLELFPSGRSGNMIAKVFRSSAASAPSSLQGLIRSAANAVAPLGPWFGVGMALLFLAIASVGISVGRRQILGVALGSLIALSSWIFGESLGGLSSGIATDPNTGPLLIVFAIAVIGAQVPNAHRIATTEPLICGGSAQRSSNAA